ncbi:tripartite motif-containing protein 2-like [Dysidea avara]|uniref:tripartite motif-containing protein 2-like n=1 Tax=Dysidea avara TaxID=196820 RepID=UPI0033349D52
MAARPRKPAAGYLTCPVCYDLCLNPKYLPCHHTYCEMCLVKIKVESDLICKKCGKVSSVPADGVKELPDNFFCSRVVDEVNLKSKLMSDEAKCDHCVTKEGTAIALCLECGTLMCQYCYDYHKSSTEYQDHSTMPLGEVRVKPPDVKPKAKLAVCREHDIELKFYCETCEQLVCHYCITKTHLNHNHDTVKKMAEKHRKELNKIMEPAQNMIDGLSTAQKTVKIVDDKINLQANDIDKDISKHYEQVQQLLQQQREDLRKEVQEALMQKKNKVLVQLERMEDIRTELECLKELNDEMKRGSDQETLLMKKCVLDDMKKLSDCYKKMDTEPVESATMEFMPVKEDEQGNLLPMFGMVYTVEFEFVGAPEYAFAREETEFNIIGNSSNKRRSEVIVQAQSSRGDVIPVKVVGDSNGNYLASFIAHRIGGVKILATTNGQHIKGSPHTMMVYRNYHTISKPNKIVNNMDSPWGIAISRDGTWAVSDSNHCVWVFSSNVKKFGGFGDGNGQFNKPHGVAFDDDDNLYVTDHSNHRVQRFTKDGNYINPSFGKHGSGDGQLNYPVGIVIYNGCVYVVDHGNSRLSVFQSDSGKFCHTISGPIRNPYYIAVSSKGQLLVTDNTLFCVLVFNVNGDYVTKYGMPGVERGQLSNPIGLATDENGFLFVCEYGNHRVSIFDKDGVFVHCFGSNGSDAGEFVQPYGMALSPNGSIYVCDYTNKRVQIFSFL